ncbi:FtsK/SpoIIIE domain-containing protein [Bifidobacterium sp.]|uniref:FtsK/SpoIIIE domain-containing protein n=1 Tax=Bifidobacterium sp. TaxID=41200 RepID=UPI0025BAA950|nr:FtsK/SpoIIIE domain-containing protein [Bifidobacterium sp.]MCH4209161.1 cell division protein FtsK [Bifidobacterium sp.]MCI1224607.1 cell division protein FtsK [Bifidobacterium sp.]
MTLRQFDFGLRHRHAANASVRQRHAQPSRATNADDSAATDSRVTDSKANRRLSLLRYGTPALAQLMMLVLLVAERRWLFALMFTPGLMIPLASLLTAKSERAARKQQSNVASTGATATNSSQRDDDMRDLRCPSLETLLGLDEEPLLWRSISRGWLSSSGLRAVMAMARTGPFAIDLERQGPHALVAGTTGSGKSVLLQSWCLALALANPPDRVQFVFLDFKGGSAFARLEALPHVVGSVCDLDLNHAVRALLAVENELSRRERLVASHRAGDITGLRERPASLVIVVDEFHALSGQLPDYVGRLSRIASLGRSLGMHVIACTQNPLGQVSADMKANMSLNICLRVRDGLQSHELLGSAKAAAISPELPGIAYCNDGAQAQAIRCAAANDIDRLVLATQSAQRFRGGHSSPALFSAPLPRSVHRLSDHLGYEPTVSRDAVPFALGDTGVDMIVASVPVGRGNIAIIGSQGRGKTTLLHALGGQICALAHAAAGLQVRWTDRKHDGMPPNIWAESSQRIADLRADGSTHAGQILRMAENARSFPMQLGDASDEGAARGCHRPNVRHTMWLIDDADEWMDPLSTDPKAGELRRALKDPAVTVVFALHSTRHLRFPEHCTIRIVLPTGERAVDLMNGIPAGILSTFDQETYSIAGRAVLLRDANAMLVQCAQPVSAASRSPATHSYVA